jgi:murein L,D-transpeptidase YafK
MQRNILLVFLVVFAAALTLAATAPHTGSVVQKRAYRAATNATPFELRIYKHRYELELWDSLGLWMTYPVVFGSSELKDKLMEGDRQTPEGRFRIVHKKIHPEWGHFLLLDYPTPADLQKFQQRKQAGIIPPNARPGGGIGIHATRRNEDRFVDFFYNWTNGCISTKREYAQELYELLPVGTPVSIFP